MLNSMRRLSAEIQEKREAVLPQLAEISKEADMECETEKANLEREKKCSDKGFQLDLILKLAIMKTTFERVGNEDKAGIVEILVNCSRSRTCCVLTSLLQRMFEDEMIRTAAEIRKA